MLILLYLVVFFVANKDISNCAKCSSNMTFRLFSTDELISTLPSFPLTRHFCSSVPKFLVACTGLYNPLCPSVCRSRLAFLRRPCPPARDQGNRVSGLVFISLISFGFPVQSSPVQFERSQHHGKLARLSLFINCRILALKTSTFMEWKLKKKCLVWFNTFDLIGFFFAPRSAWKY